MTLAATQATARGAILCCFRFPACSALLEATQLLLPENLFGAAAVSPSFADVFGFSGGGATVNPPTLVDGGFIGGKFSLTLTFKSALTTPSGYLCKPTRCRPRRLRCGSL